MLEPRRIAARNLAEYMASQLGERVGQTIGYRIRQESKVSKETRLEIITEGVLTRLIQADPLLDGVSVVIFDEFHERHLQGDLALALALEVQQINDELKLIVMSATLDQQQMQQVMPDAAVLSSEGRSYPITLHYRSAQSQEYPDQHITRVIKEAASSHEGNLLVFLPGVADIRRQASRLESELASDIDIFPLYGALSLDEQRKAIDAPDAGRRKLVLTTNIAETSLTIEGVSVVVDSGTEKRAEFNPRNQLLELNTRRISQASSVQRAGRAGRLMAGHCYRLWPEDEQSRLTAFIAPEVERADLAPLALELALWGSDELTWVTPPPVPGMAVAKGLLKDLGCCDDKGKITAHGRQVAALGVHPRIGHMLLSAAEEDKWSCILAAVVLEQRSGRDVDMAERIAKLDQEKRSKDYQLALGLAKRLKVTTRELTVARLGLNLARAFPDRIALKRTSGGYQLANGKGVALDGYLERFDMLVVADLGGDSKTPRAHLAAAFDPEWLETDLETLVTRAEVASWDNRGFVAEVQTRVGHLVLSRAPHPSVSEEVRVAGLLDYLKQKQLEDLDWNPEVEQLLARLTLARSLFPQKSLPDVSREMLVANCDSWLAPYLTQIKKIAQLKGLNLVDILSASLDWETQQWLNQALPLRFKLPSGNSYPINYLAQQGPTLEAKLQELFGQAESPTIAQGKISLILNLLSPARRPLAMTRDLAFFWQNAYKDVQKEMKGRYPKHPWPDDPIQAIPTAKTKRQLNS